MLGVRDKGTSFQDVVEGMKTGLSKHATAAEIREGIGADRYDGYFSFALVRRPEDRIYSLYKWSAKLGRAAMQFGSVSQDTPWTELTARFRNTLRDGGIAGFLDAPPPNLSEGAMS